MTLIDIGANLGHESFDDDLEAVLERARAAGVMRCGVTGSDWDSSRRAVTIARRYPNTCFATAGLHPHAASEWHDDLADWLRRRAAARDVSALGETGLDFFRDISPRARQEHVFAAQLEIAAEHARPVFLHQREAHARFLPILREYLPRIPRAVVHCFTDDRAALDDYLAADCYIGITGWICDERRGADLFHAVGAIPDDRLMIETDCPYLLPRTIRPKPRSRRNEPAYLPWVLSRVAEARGQPAAHVAAITRANAQRFFALPDND